jgi:hypothetical protein
MSDTLQFVVVKRYGQGAMLLESFAPQQTDPRNHTKQMSDTLQFVVVKRYGRAAMLLESFRTTTD